MRTRKSFVALAAIAAITAPLAACSKDEETTTPVETTTTEAGYKYERQAGLQPTDEAWWPLEIELNSSTWERSDWGDDDSATMNGRLSHPVTYTNKETFKEITYLFDSEPTKDVGTLVADEEARVSKVAGYDGSQRAELGDMNCIVPMLIDNSSEDKVNCYGKASLVNEGIFTAISNSTSYQSTYSLLNQIREMTGMNQEAEDLKNEVDLGTTTEGVKFNSVFDTSYTLRLKEGYMLEYRLETKLAPMRVKLNTVSPTESWDELEIVYGWKAEVKNITKSFEVNGVNINPSLVMFYQKGSPVCTTKVAQHGVANKATDQYTPMGMSGPGGNYCAIFGFQTNTRVNGLAENAVLSTSNITENRIANAGNESYKVEASAPGGEFSKILPSLEKPAATLLEIAYTKDRPDILTGACDYTYTYSRRGVPTETSSVLLTPDSTLCTKLGGKYIAPTRNN